MRRSLERILASLQEGSIKTPPITTFPLDKVAQAHQALQSGSTIGKLVLTRA
jgi:NADPH:quinone reductase-like Zn-dependent oxidoreductase